MSGHRVISLVAASALGCTHAAILELTVELPAPEPGGPTHAVVDARPGDVPAFDGAGDLSTFDLRAERSGRVSIVAGSEHHARPLYVRTRFCVDPRCRGEGDPPHALARIERAFYAGEHTFVTLRIGEVPAGAAVLPDVGRCEVRGCVAGESPTGYCLADDRHLCER